MSQPKQFPFYIGETYYDLCRECGEAMFIDPDGISYHDDNPDEDMDHVPIAEHEPSEAPKPYTVVVELLGHDIDGSQNQERSVFATSPELAGTLAIDALIVQQNPEIADNDQEDAWERWREDYGIIAIYEGHHTNLAEQP